MQTGGVGRRPSHGFRGEHLPDHDRKDGTRDTDPDADAHGQGEEAPCLGRCRSRQTAECDEGKADGDRRSCPDGTPNGRRNECEHAHAEDRQRTDQPGHGMGHAKVRRDVVDEGDRADELRSQRQRDDEQDGEPASVGPSTLALGFSHLLGSSRTRPASVPRCDP